MIRILTAIVLLSILGGALWGPRLAFVLVLAVFLAVAWNEYATLAAEAGATPLRGLGAPLAIACAASFAHPDPRMPVVMFGATSLLAALAGLAAGKQHPGLAVRRVMATIGGLVWLGLLPGFCVALRYTERGVALIVLLFAAVACADIFAYYGGSLFGRHPLAPELSPKKTLEGTGFGLTASAIGAAVVCFYWLPETTWPTGLGVGLLLGVVAQAGDLFESSLKRAAGAKDSSRILPGHGGVLDRLDGLLFAGTALYACVFFGVL